jgi:hypothetical protein
MAMNRRQRERRTAADNASGARIDDATAARPAITLDIGEVVLRGIDPGDRNALAAVLERELVSVLGDGGMPRTLRAGGRDRVDGGVISLKADENAPAIGRQIAHAVQRSLIEPMRGKDGAKISRH